MTGTPDDRKPKVIPQVGEFPFCSEDISNSADTPAVTRWRNRSQYLTRRIFHQLATALYQYNRGVFGNLVLLSLVLVPIALLVAWRYNWMRQHPYAGSLTILASLLILAILNFIASSDWATEPQAPSASRWNNHYHLILFALLAVAAVESVPPCLELIRYLRPSGTISATQALGALAIAASVSSVLRFVWPTGSFGQQCTRLTIGLVSWLMFATILISLTDYLYYGIPPYGLILLVPPLAAGVALSATLYSFFRTIAVLFNTRLKYPWVYALFAFFLGFYITLLVAPPLIEQYSIECRFGAQRVAEIVRPLTRVDRAIDEEIRQHSNQRMADLAQQAGESRQTTPFDDTPDQQTMALLTTLADKRRALEWEYNAGWAKDYKATVLASYLPWIEAWLTYQLPQDCPNMPLYHNETRSGEITEWGILYPLRPNYHRRALEYMSAFTAMERLTPSANEKLLRQLTRHCVADLAKACQSRGDGDYSRENNKQLLFQAAVVRCLISLFLPANGAGGIRFEAYSLHPATIPGKRFDRAECDDMVKKLFEEEALVTAIKGLTLPPINHSVYESILADDTAGTENTPPPSKSTQEALKELYESELRKFHARCKTDMELQYSILAEALLACLDRLMIAQDKHEAEVIQLLRALPDSLTEDKLFNVSGKSLDEWTELFRMTPVDLATAAAGIVRIPEAKDETSVTLFERLKHYWRPEQNSSRRPASIAYDSSDVDGLGEGGDSRIASVLHADQTQRPGAPHLPEDFLADAFRLSVCGALDCRSDIASRRTRPAYRFVSRARDVARTKSSGNEQLEQRRAQVVLFHRCMRAPFTPKDISTRAQASLAELYRPSIPTSQQVLTNLWDNEQLMQTLHNSQKNGAYLLPETILRLFGTRLAEEARLDYAQTLRIIGTGRFGNLENLGRMVDDVSLGDRWVKVLLLIAVWLAALFFGLVFIDPNLTSIHGFYRDSLSSAFLFSPATQTGIDKAVPEGLQEDTNVKLSELADRTHGSTAPYPLINASVNVPSERRESIRQRCADPFLFSPWFVGLAYHSSDESTPQYVNTKTFERLYPSFTVASAMTISGAAVSPLMGRYTNWLLRLTMVVANIRLGYWIRDPLAMVNDNPETLEAVRERELRSIAWRREHARLRKHTDPVDNVVGLAFSGGGIRSAAINFGVSQALFRSGIWKFVDYLSTVSGGGYVGSSICVFMRRCSSAEGVAIPDADKPKEPGSTRAAPTDWRACLFPASLCLFGEVFGRAPSRSKWVCVTDGGHFENLGVYALLQRKCTLIIVGDGEADPKGETDGLTRLSMLALTDLGVRLEFPDGDLRRMVPAGANSERHFTVAKIRYRDNSTGWLIYLRSSVTGDENEFIRGYKAKNDAFPHESTTDQFFTEEQFEAYRRLGEHIANDAVRGILSGKPFADHAGLVAAAELFFVARTSSLATHPPFATPGP